jgi:hypothetical protein
MCWRLVLLHAGQQPPTALASDTPLQLNPTSAVLIDHIAANLISLMPRGLFNRTG